MIKLIYKFSILSFILLAVGILLNHLIVLPFSWGNKQLVSKVAYLESCKKTPKAYFLGSSITYHGVNPTIFCEVVNKPQAYAFNLGLDGALPPNTIYLLDELIEKSEEIEYIFFELNSFDHLPDHIFQTTRGKYYYKIEHLWMSIKYFCASNHLKTKQLNFTHKLGIIGKHGLTFFESLFKIGLRKEIIASLENKKKGQVRGLKGMGYRPIKGKQKQEKADIDRLSNYLNSLEGTYKDAYSDKAKQGGYYNIAFQRMLTELIVKAENKGIQLIYLLIPFEHAFDSAPEMLALFESLPIKNKIDLADPYKHPELYDLANRWDNGHFNDAGAKIYTKKLAESFNQLAN